jgi:hypothetical protein
MDASSLQTGHDLMGPNLVNMAYFVGHCTQGTPVSVLFDGWYGTWCCYSAPALSVPSLFLPLLNFLTKMYQNATVNHTAYCCPLRKPLHYQGALCVPENRGHLLASKGSCPEFLGLRTSIVVLLHGLPFIFRGGNETISYDWPSKETVGTLTVNHEQLMTFFHLPFPFVLASSPVVLSVHTLVLSSGRHGLLHELLHDRGLFYASVHHM